MKKYRLPKKFAKKFINALRSGDYTQVQFSLYNGSGYCALGVACAISGIENSMIRGMAAIHDGVLPVSDIPRELMYGEKLAEEIISLNDGSGYSFKAIAEWIEAEVELYDEPQEEVTIKNIEPEYERL